MNKERLIRILRGHTIGFWIWTLVAFALVITLSSLLAKIFFAHDLLTKEALEAGQRVTIKIASGEADGNGRHTKRAESGNSLPLDGSAGATITSKEGLAPAPLAAITEQSDKGLVPIIGKDGTVPWKYYARPYTPATKKPMVAILLTNLGLSRPLTEDVLKLTHNFTLSFSPYAGDAKVWARKAREEGFESMVDLPMQPDNYPLSDPGPYGLLEDLNPNESSARLHWVLSRFTGFVGVLSPGGEKMTANTNAMRPILIELAARGVLFLYVKNPKNPELAELAKARGFYTLPIDAVVDEEISPSGIEKQLINLVSLARTQGHAIGIAHSYPTTIEALVMWQTTLAQQGIDLVPVSAIATQVLAQTPIPAALPPVSATPPTAPVAATPAPPVAAAPTAAAPVTTEPPAASEP